MSTTISPEDPEDRKKKLKAANEARDARQEQLDKGREAAAKREQVFWSMVWARTKYWTWTITTKLVITVLYLEIVSSGVINIAPDMGKRVWKIPFFSFLNGFEIFPIIATWLLWSLLLSMYLAPSRFDERFKRFGLARTRQVILIIGIIVILADGGIFCAGFSMSAWGGSKFSATAVLATALYCALLAFVSLMSLFLGDEITILKEKAKDT